MKVKIVGFKVGVARPTCNYTATLDETMDFTPVEVLGGYVWRALKRSDFISIRRVD